MPGKCWNILCRWFGVLALDANVGMSSLTWHRQKVTVEVLDEQPEHLQMRGSKRTACYLCLLPSKHLDKETPSAEPRHLAEKRLLQKKRPPMSICCKAYCQTGEGGAVSSQSPLILPVESFWLCIRSAWRIGGWAEGRTWRFGHARPEPSNFKHVH